MLWDDRIGRRLRLKDLHTLQTVAEVGSMAKASKLLALSQPAISKAIADMEHTLGAPLLDRTSRGVELTDCGHTLVERARVIFDEIRLGVKEIEHWTDPTQGEVRIGTTDPASGIVSEIISQLARKHPRITYRVLVSDTDTLERELRERTLDVLLTGWATPRVADDLAAEVLYSAPLAVMADKNHRLVARKKVKLADLMEERWTLSPQEFFPRPHCRRCLSTQRAPVSTGCRDYDLDLHAAEPAGKWRLPDRAAYGNAPPAVQPGMAARARR